MHILHSSFQPKIQKDLLQQERRVLPCGAKAMLNRERMCDSVFLLGLRELLEVHVHIYYL